MEDEGNKHVNPNPCAKANALSKLFFWWLNPLFALGYKRPLEVTDMYNVLDQDSSEVLCARLQCEWDKELEKLKTKGKPSLFKAVLRAFGFQYACLGVLVFMEEAVKVSQILFLGQLISYFREDSDISRQMAFMYAFGLSMCAITLAIVHHPYFYQAMRMGMCLRIACCSLMYRKSLRLSNTSMEKTTVGQIVNLMSNDVNRFDQVTLFLHFLWVGPLEAIAVFGILWYHVGPACLAGFALLILLIPVQGSMGKLFAKYRVKIAVQTDERVRLMNEILNAVRVIKMYCWELMFSSLVQKVRRLEVKRILFVANIKASTLAPFFSSGKMMVFLVFITYILLGNTITAEKVFIAIGLFNPVRLVMHLFIPFAIQMMAESRVTLKRIQNFMLMEERENSESIQHTGLQPKSSDCKVSLKEVNASWDKSPAKGSEHLRNISVEVNRGELVAVIGPVGSGKSSLLLSILGEMNVVSGRVNVQGSVSYASQTPWIFSATLRQNITFGKKFDKVQYDKVIKACALTRDLSLLKDGDLTLVGERGVSLSGGQRARVSLARALYSNADVVLMDDPLSAVDAAVGKHLFENCICGMLRDRPRILVTHQLQFLVDATKIIIMNNGEIVDSGTYEDLAKGGVDFASLLKREDEEEKEEVEQIADLAEHEETEAAMMDAVSHQSLAQTMGSLISLKSIDADVQPDYIPTVSEEARRTGTVSWWVYIRYFTCGAGWLGFLLLILLNLLSQGLYIVSDWWLSYWATMAEHRHQQILLQESMPYIYTNGDYNTTGYNMSYSNTTVISIPPDETMRNIYIFVGLTAAVFVFGCIRALYTFHVLVRSSEKLHNKMLDSIIRAPVLFFDSNPTGRILNRFSKDTGQMDEMLPVTVYDFLQCLLLILGCILVAGVVNPWVFIPTVPLTCLFFFLRNYFLATSRDVKRLEGTTRSPVFTHINATMSGLSTVRAFNAQHTFLTEFDAHQDLHTEAHFLFLTTSRWFAIRLDLLCALFVSSVSFSCVIATGGLNSGLVGLVLTYAIQLMGLFQWGVRQSAEVENQMTSVERVMDYSLIASEAALQSEPENKPASDWPQHGIITAEGATFRYSADGDVVLNDLHFCIRAKEKVGIVGRTGAGKSSIIAMLFRLAEPQGSICIDSVDITKIGLHELRRKIAIIPQDPVLFSRSVRRNLDPFSEHEDETLWAALEGVELKSVIVDIAGGLDGAVSEGGTNFSVGQRQLICLARALLRRNRILVIDEATANVDPRTDALIQQTIRQKFSECTVLTIAHRLHTIMDSDRVMTLDSGRIVEFDEPYILLQNEDSYLSNLVEQVGKSESEQLLDIAKQAYFVRNQQCPEDIMTKSDESAPLTALVPSESVGSLQLQSIV